MPLRSAYTLYKNPSVWNIPPSLFIGFFDDIFYREFIAGEGVSNPSTNFLVLLGFLFALGHFKDLLRDSAYRAVGISAIVAITL
jgi:hypothetical protein